MSAQVPTIATGQYDNNRTGANLNETTLNIGNVNVNQFGKITQLPLDGREYGNGLFIPNVMIPLSGGGTRTTNVLYFATQKNTVFAFDANTLSTTPIWSKNLGPAVPSQSAAGGFCPAFSAGNELGIESSPVIDTTTGTIYSVSTSPNSTGSAYKFFLNALDIATGQPKFGSPIQIQGQVSGTGYDSVSGVITFNEDARHSQRTSILLSGGNLYLGFGSCGPDADPWHGWVFSYNASNLSQNWVFNTTPNDQRGGVWQSGMGPVADSAGNIYFTTGNGNPNSADAYSDGVVKLTSGGTPTGYQFPNWQLLSKEDLDVSTVGPILVPNTNSLLVGGKLGVVTVFDVSGGNLAPQQSFQATNACPMPVVGGDSTCHKMRNDAFWSDGATGGTLYVWGSSSTDPLNAFKFSNGAFNITPSSQNTNVSLGAKDATFAVSANKSDPASGILWVNTQTQLWAFNASNVANQLWNNQQNAARDGGFQFPHWVEPVVAQGRVYIPYYNNDAGGIAVFGLLPNPNRQFSVAVSPATQTLLQGTNTSYTVTVAPLNGFTGAVSLSVQGLPSGATASFSPASITGTGTSTLVISTSISSTPGGYSLSIVGTSGTATQTASALMIVQVPSSAGMSVPLSGFYNRTGIANDGTTFSGGLDGVGNAYSAKLLGTAQTYNNLSFRLGPPNAPDVISGGATIPLPSGTYSTLSLLGTGVNGAQANQVFTVTYTDGTKSTFTQSLSNWKPGSNFTGETTVLSMSYRNFWNATSNVGTFNLFGYSFTLNPNKTVSTLTLPNNANVITVAVTLLPATTAVQVSLASSYNTLGIVTDEALFETGGADRDGNAYSSTLLGSSMTFNGSTFSFGQANAVDMLRGTAVPVPLPAGSYTTLNMLGAGVNGLQKNQTFTVTYSDGTTSVLTQSMSNWVPNGNQVGETTVKTMAYRDVWNGSKSATIVGVYGYTFQLNSTKTLSTITIPNNLNVIVLGLSLIK